MMLRIAFLTFALATTPAGSSVAKPESAQAFLLRVYEPYTREFSESIYENLPSYITPELQTLLMKSSEGADARGEVPPLNGDPVVHAQEWELKGLEIGIKDAGAGKAVGTVRFLNYEQATTIVVDLVRIGGGWRIADFHYDGGRSLSGYLKTSIAQETAWMSKELSPLIGKPRLTQPLAGWSRNGGRLIGGGLADERRFGLDVWGRGRQLALLFEKSTGQVNLDPVPTVIDVIWFNMSRSQHFVVGCSVAGASDTEVVGVVGANPSVQRTGQNAIKAWRLDRSTGKIREIPSAKVSCRSQVDD
jgi:hypothetical protein